MVKQVFSIEHYWKVIVYWDMDYNFFNDVEWEMKMASLKESTIQEVWKIMKKGEAKAVTCSSIENHISIVLFNTHSSATDYISSIVHEAEHIKQAILKAYQIDDEGEAPAYTVGYIVSQMWEVFKKILSSP